MVATDTSITVPQHDRRAALTARLGTVRRNIHDRLLAEHAIVTGELARPPVARAWQDIILEVLGLDLADLDVSDCETVQWLADSLLDERTLAGILSLIQLAAPRGAIRWDQHQRGWVWTCPVSGCGLDQVGGRPFSQIVQGMDLVDVIEFRDAHIAEHDDRAEADR